MVVYVVSKRCAGFLRLKRFTLGRVGTRLGIWDVVAAEDLHTSLDQDRPGGGMDHAPMNNGRRRIRLLASKTHYFSSDQIEVLGQLIRERVLIWTIGELRISMKGKLEPVRAARPFSFVGNWKPRKVEIVFRCGVKDIQNKLRSILSMQFAESVKVKTIEE